MSKKLAICVPHYKREEHLKKFAEEEGLTTISPRLPDQATTPNEGTTMD